MQQRPRPALWSDAPPAMGAASHRPGAHDPAYLHPDDAGYGPGGGLPPGRGQRLLRLAGAAGSVALIAGLVWWGWDLAMRDIRGVPVVRAVEGPMRIAPEDPGGQVVDHQGLAVNDVAAEGGVAAPPDRLVLAPAPVTLSEEDQAGLLPATDAPPVDPATLEEGPDASPMPTAVPAPPADAVPVIDGGQEDAVAAALAMALGETDLGEGGVVETATLDDQGNPPPEGAITRSPRPVARPGASASPSTTRVETPVSAPQAVDPATLAPGTRLVQFGAYDSVEQAEQEWVRIAQRFGDLMAGKGMVVQAAESGGRTFYRLRATGFAAEQDSRRFCAALEAESVKCIPVAHR